MTALTLEELISSVENPTVSRVELPELGEGKFACVRACSSPDWDVAQASHLLARESGDPERFRGFRAKFVAKCLCDENGRYLNPSPEQLARFCSQSPALIMRLFEAAELLCTGDEAIEEAEKN